MVEIVQIDENGAAAFDKDVVEILDEAATALGKPFTSEGMYLRADDENGGRLGGLSGYSMQGWLFVRYLAVAPQARGRGIGRDLLARAEALAREQGLAGVYLDTFDFQAPEFYTRLGYAELGRLPEAGGAPGRIWFAKVLAQDC